MSGGSENEKGPTSDDAKGGDPDGEAMRGPFRSTWYRRLARHRPPGPFRPEFWRSPIRGPWLTSVLGSVLLVGIPVLIVTGALSYAAYNPDLGGNDLTPESGLSALLPRWPTDPQWLFRLNQGTHVTLGLVLVPVVLAKLWSVMPKLFAWPPVRSLAQLAERISLIFLVGGVVFQFATGIVNIQYWYVFPSSFYRAHLYGAYAFTGAFIVHVALKLPTLRRTLRDRPVRQELRIDLAGTEPEPPDETGLVPVDPNPPTISRRGAVGAVSAGSLLLFITTAGQNLSGWTRTLALMAPRGRDSGDGPNDFQVNKTAESRGITSDQIDDSWRLELRSASSTRSFSRQELAAMELHDAELAINCVEGWSTGLQHWRGMRLRDLAALADAADARAVLVESLENSIFGSTTLAENQIRDSQSLLALYVNGVDISPDHGFPARVIVPANPGVHNTKWVARMTFQS